MRAIAVIAVVVLCACDDDDVAGAQSDAEPVEWGVARSLAPWVYGVRVTDAVAAVVTDDLVLRLTGGTGRRHANGQGAAAGKGIGFSIERSRGARLLQNAARQVASAPSHGPWLEGVHDDVLVDASNTLDGQPMFYADGVAGSVVVEGLRQDESAATTNLGHIVVRDVRDVVIRDNRLVGPEHPSATWATSSRSASRTSPLRGQRLASHLDSDLMAHAGTEPEAADPAWHRACQGRHTYVDV